MGNINMNLVERCSFDKVFDEEKQQCVKAEKSEDLECLLRVNSQFKSTTSTTTKSTTKASLKQKKKTQDTVSKSTKSKSELEAIFQALHLNPFGYYSDEDDEEAESVKAPPAKSKTSRKVDSNPPKKEQVVTPNKKDRRDHSENQNRNRINKLRKKSSDSDLLEEETSEYENDEEEEDEYYYDDESEDKDKVKIERDNGRIIQVESKEKLDNGTKTIDRSDIKDDNQYKRMCVVTNWSQYRSGRGRFQYDFIEPYLCNYVIYTSVKVEEEEDPDYEDFVIRGIQHNEKELYAKLKILKAKNPELKLILKITDDGGIVFSKLSKSFDTRANLVENVLE
jgi:hypothetical protein